MKEKRNVGIATMYNNNYNYGGMLQAFALREIIEAKGFNCEIISFEISHSKYLFSRYKNIGFKKSSKIFKKKVISYLKKVCEREYAEGIEIRQNLFKNFEQEIPHSPFYNEKSIKDSLSRYDIFVCGSDQIWNPGLWNDIYLLKFVPPHIKKISYAASIGRNNLSDKEVKCLKDALMTFSAISVRESDAREIVQKLTQNPVYTVLDPTLVLPSTKWEVFAQHNDLVKDKEYAFLFFLGEGDHNRRKAYQFCKERGITAVTIPHLQTGYKKEDIEFSDVQIFNATPQQWVGLILNAKYVFTDSFHGTAFSIKLCKQFYSFDRDLHENRHSGTSRLLSLFIQLGIEDRMIGKDDALCERKVNYLEVNQKLGKLVEKSHDFLDNALIDAVISR